jgi:hypothetical protein
MQRSRFRPFSPRHSLPNLSSSQRPKLLLPHTKMGSPLLRFSAPGVIGPALSLLRRGSTSEVNRVAGTVHYDWLTLSM